MQRTTIFVGNTENNSLCWNHKRTRPLLEDREQQLLLEPQRAQRSRRDSVCESIHSRSTSRDSLGTAHRESLVRGSSGGSSQSSSFGSWRLGAYSVPLCVLCGSMAGSVDDSIQSRNELGFFGTAHRESLVRGFSGGSSQSSSFGSWRLGAYAVPLCVLCGSSKGQSTEGWIAEIADEAQR
jgi:hypothetical protein